MEYQKIIKLLYNTPNQLSKFKTKNWIEINDQSCILVKGRITITGAEADAAARQADERDKGVIFKNCAQFINCKSEIIIQK